ncbi:MAG TPA: hypothetical protein VH186_35270 [Chloroflexia bacterium]|nr:hypothetical protein [Chloroflexia bacterium]
MTLLRIDLRLKPAPQGLQELAEWPGRNFTPDFIVAASGLARFELDDKVMAVPVDSHGSRIESVNAAELDEQKYNPWLPDYIAGFALNLADATAAIKAKKKTQAHARFIDETLELILQSEPEEPGSLTLSFYHASKPVQSCKGPASLFYAEIGRSLQDLVVQLLNINPALSDYNDIERLRGWICQIVAR